MNQAIAPRITIIAILLAGHFGFEIATAAEQRTKPDTVFAPTNSRYMPLPADVPLHPNSADSQSPTRSSAKLTRIQLCSGALLCTPS
jgi:hypothetical protein